MACRWNAERLGNTPTRSARPPGRRIRMLERLTVKKQRCSSLWGPTFRCAALVPALRSAFIFYCCTFYWF